MTLKDALSRWDGKSASEISELYHQFSSESTFSRDLIHLLNDSVVQKGASWLLKKYLGEGQKLSADVITVMYQQLELSGDWETNLHILQILPCTEIPLAQKPETENFIRGCLNSQQKFVRAWAYNAFCCLAKQFPEYIDEARELLDKGLEGEAASVKARIRNILKEGTL